MVSDGVARYAPMMGTIDPRETVRRGVETAPETDGFNGAPLHNLDVNEGLFSAPYFARVQQLDVALSHEQETKVQLNHLKEASDQVMELVLPKASEQGQFATLRYIVDESGDLHITEKYVKSSASQHNLSLREILPELGMGVESTVPVWQPPNVGPAPQVTAKSEKLSQDVQVLESVLDQLLAGPQVLPQPINGADSQSVLLGLVMQMASYQKRAMGIQVADLNVLLGRDAGFAGGSQASQTAEVAGRVDRPSGGFPRRALLGFKNWLGRMLSGNRGAQPTEALAPDRFANAHLRANLLLAHEAYRAYHGASESQQTRVQAALHSDATETQTNFAKLFGNWPGAEAAVTDALNRLDLVGVTARLAVLAAETRPDVGTQERMEVFEIRLRGKLATALSVLRTQNVQEKSLMSLEYDALVVSLANNVVAKYFPQRL